MRRFRPSHRSRYRPLRLAVLLLPALWAVSGCSSITGADPGPLEFSAAQLRPGSDDPIPELGAVGGDGQIRFRGAIETPVPCYDVEGEVDFQGDVVMLDVVATPRDVVCVQVLATFGYEGLITGVDPGFYEVEIAHVREDARDVVFEGGVEVE